MEESTSKTTVDKRLFDIFGLMRPEEVAEVFGVTEHAVRKWIGLRVIPFIRFRGSNYVHVESLKKHLKDSEVRPNGDHESWKALEGRSLGRGRKDCDSSL